MFALTFHHPLFRQLRRLDRHGLDGANELPGERCINAKPTKYHTPTHAKCCIAAVTAIGGHAVTSRVDDAQPTAAAVAYQKAGEKSAAAAARLGTILAAVGVGGELLLVPLELPPVDVAFVVILQQDLAVLQRAMVAVGLARPTVNDLSPVDAFAVGVDAGIEWVLQH